MSENTSQNRRRANRINAQKSTGPKTAQGKGNVRHNAVKHGLYSPDIIINSPHLKENAEEYDLLLASLMAELKPVGLLQESLVRKIADCLWRMRRVIRAETAEISRGLEYVDRDLNRASTFRDLMGIDSAEPYDNSAEAETARRRNMIGVSALPGGTAAINILRYEMRLDRQLTRTLRLFLYLQKTNNITADLYELGPPEYEETNPTTDPPSQPETGNPPTTCDARRPADDEIEICQILGE